MKLVKANNLACILLILTIILPTVCQTHRPVLSENEIQKLRSSYPFDSKQPAMVSMLPLSIEEVSDHTDAFALAEVIEKIDRYEGTFEGTGHKELNEKLKSE